MVLLEERLNISVCAIPKVGPREREDRTFPALADCLGWSLRDPSAGRGKTCRVSEAFREETQQQQDKAAWR